MAAASNGGTLTVHVKAGRKLKNQDSRWSKQDPYVCVWVEAPADPVTARGKPRGRWDASDGAPPYPTAVTGVVKKGGTDPTWKDEHGPVLSLVLPAGGSGAGALALWVEAWDQDSGPLDSDDLIGVGCVRLATPVGNPGTAIDLDVALTDADKGKENRGTIEISVTFTPAPAPVLKPVEPAADARGRGRPQPGTGAAAAPAAAASGAGAEAAAAAATPHTPPPKQGGGGGDDVGAVADAGAGGGGGDGGMGRGAARPGRRYKAAGGDSDAGAGDAAGASSAGTDVGGAAAGGTSELARAPSNGVTDGHIRGLEAPTGTAAAAAAATPVESATADGTLSVEVISASLKRDLDFAGKMDPYTVACVRRAPSGSLGVAAFAKKPRGKQSEPSADCSHTSTIDGAGKTPKWGETVHVSVAGSAAGPQVLWLEVWDEDPGSDEFVGGGLFPDLGSVAREGAPGLQAEVPLIDKKKREAGTLTVRVSFAKVKPAPAEPVPAAAPAPAAESSAVGTGTPDKPKTPEVESGAAAAGAGAGAGTLATVPPTPEPAPHVSAQTPQQPAPQHAGVSVDGTLSIRVLDATLAHDHDAFGKQDPYVVAWVEPMAVDVSDVSARKARGEWKPAFAGQPKPQTCARTATVDGGGKNPRWGDSDGAYLPLVLAASAEQQCVWLEVWDEDPGGRNELIGMGRYEQLGIAARGAGGDDPTHADGGMYVVPLRDAKGDDAGTLRVRVNFVEGAPPDTAGAAASVANAVAEAEIRKTSAAAAIAKRNADKEAEKAALAALPPIDLKNVSGLLTVDVVAGKKLKNMDMFGRMDPYAVCYVEPNKPPSQSAARAPRGAWRDDAGRGPAPRSYAKTGVVHKGGSDPTWGPSHGGVQEVAVLGAVEGSKRVVLWLEVWDEDDMNKDDFVGHVAVPLGEVVKARGGIVRGAFKLTNADGNEPRGEIVLGLSFEERPASELQGAAESAGDVAAAAAVLAAERGELVPGLVAPRPHPYSGELFVTVKEALNLPKAGSVYVRLSLRPGNTSAQTTASTGDGGKGKATFGQTLALPLLNDVPYPSEIRDADAVLGVLAVEVLERNSVMSDTVIADGAQSLEGVLPPRTAPPSTAGGGGASSSSARPGAEAGGASGGAAGAGAGGAAAAAALTVGGGTGGGAPPAKGPPAVAVVVKGKQPAAKEVDPAVTSVWVNLTAKRKTKSTRPPQVSLELRFRKVSSAPMTGSEPGLLRVFVQRARGLQVVDSWGDQDPFVKLSLVSGDPPTTLPFSRDAVTAVAANSGRRAVWNECFDVAVAAGIRAPTLVAHVLDKEDVLADKPIGEVRVPVADFLRGIVEGEPMESVARGGPPMCASWFSLTGDGRKKTSGKKKGGKGKGDKGKGKGDAEGGKAGIGELRLGMQFSPIPDDPVASLGVVSASQSGMVHLLVVGVRLHATAVSEADAGKMFLCVRADGRPQPAAKAGKGKKGKKAGGGGGASAFTSQAVACAVGRDAVAQALGDDVDDSTGRTVMSAAAVWDQYASFPFVPPPAGGAAAGAGASAGAGAFGGAASQDGQLERMLTLGDDTQTTASMAAADSVSAAAAEAELAGRLDDKGKGKKGKGKKGKGKKGAAVVSKGGDGANFLPHLWLTVADARKGTGKDSVLGSCSVPFEAMTLGALTEGADAEGKDGGGAVAGAGRSDAGASRGFAPLDKWVPFHDADTGKVVGDVRVAGVYVPTPAPAAGAAGAYGGGGAGGVDEPAPEPDAASVAGKGIAALRARAAHGAGITPAGGVSAAAAAGAEAAAKAAAGGKKKKGKGAGAVTEPATIPTKQAVDRPRAMASTPGRVQVTLVKARALRVVQKLGGKQDPFAEVTAVRGGSPAPDEAGGKGHWRSTRVHENGHTAPEWEETMTVAVEDAATTVLRIRVRERGFLGDSVIGECAIPLCLFEGSPEDDADAGRLWYQLTHGGLPAGQVLVHMRFQPEPAVALRIPELTASGTLFVDCVRGTSLKDVESLGKQDPVCTASILPAVSANGKGPASARTKVAEDAGTDPVWDETLALPYDGAVVVAAAEAGTCPTLRLDVADAGFMTTFIGGASMSLAPLLANEGVVFERELRLGARSIGAAHHTAANNGTILVRAMFCEGIQRTAAGSNQTQHGGEGKDGGGGGGGGRGGGGGGKGDDDDEDDSALPEEHLVPTLHAASIKLRAGPPRGVGSESRLVDGRLRLTVVRARNMARMRKLRPSEQVAVSVALAPEGISATTRATPAASGSPVWDDLVTLDSSDCTTQIVSFAVHGVGSGSKDVFGTVDVPMLSLVRVAEASERVVAEAIEEKVTRPHSRASVRAASTRLPRTGSASSLGTGSATGSARGIDEDDVVDDDDGASHDSSAAGSHSNFEGNSAADVPPAVDGPGQGAADIATRDADGTLKMWVPLYSRSGRKGASERAGEVLIKALFVPDGTDAANDVTTAPLKFSGSAGRLHVQLIEAENLPVSQLIGTPDPFVRASILGGDGHELWSEDGPPAIDGGKNPTWRHHMSAPINWHPAEGDVPMLKLHFLNQGSGPFGHSSIADAIVQIAPFVLFPGQVYYGWFPLGTDVRAAAADDGSESGRVRLALQFSPQAGPVAAPPVGHASRGVGAGSLEEAEVFPRSVVRSVTDASHAGEMHIQVMEARELRNVQLMGAQDPVARLTLRPGGATADSRVAVDSGTRAQWGDNILLEFNTTAGARGEGVTPVITCEVLAKGGGALPGQDATIGTAVVPVFPFVMTSGHIQTAWYPLFSRGGFAGEVRLAVQFVPDTVGGDALGGASAAVAKAAEEAAADGSVPVSVRVHEARSLRSVRWMGKQDPFVEVSVVGQGPPERTTVKSNETTEPKWGEQLRLRARAGAGDTQPQLLCVVKDACLGEDKEIGRCTLPLAMPAARGSATAVERIEAAELGSVKAAGSLAAARPDLGVGADVGKPVERWFPLRVGDGSGKVAGELKLTVVVGGAAMPKKAEETGEGVVHINVVAGVGFGDSKESVGMRLRMTPGTAARETALLLPQNAAAATVAAHALSSTTNCTKPPNPAPLLGTFERPMLPSGGPLAAGNAHAQTASAATLGTTIATRVTAGTGAVPSGAKEHVWTWQQSFVVPCLSLRRLPAVQLDARKRGFVSSTSRGLTGTWNLRQLLEEPGTALGRWIPLGDESNKGGGGGGGSGSGGGVADAELAQVRAAALSTGAQRMPQVFAIARFLPHVEGKLRVVLRGARHMRRTAIIGSQDPYALVRLLPGSVSRKTGVHEGGDSEATWESQFFFDYTNVGEVDAPRLRVVVKTSRIGMDSVVGIATVPLQNAITMPGHKREGWYTMTEKGDGVGEPCGEVLVSVKFAPSGVSMAGVHAGGDTLAGASVAAAAAGVALASTAGGTATATTGTAGTTTSTTTTAVGAAVRTAELKKMFYAMAGEDSVVSRPELERAILTDPEVRTALRAAGNDVGEALRLFDALDTDADGSVSWREFVDFIHSIGHAQKMAPVAVSDSSEDDVGPDLSPTESEGSESDGGGPSGGRRSPRRAGGDSDDDSRGGGRGRRGDPRSPEGPGGGGRRGGGGLDSPGAGGSTDPRGGLGGRHPPASPVRPAPSPRDPGPPATQRRRVKPRAPPALKPNPHQWRALDVVTWVGEWMELPQYAAEFAAASVDGPMLLTLSDKELKDDLGVHSKMHRVKLSRGIASLRGDALGRGGKVLSPERGGRRAKRGSSKRRGGRRRRRSKSPGKHGGGHPITRAPRGVGIAFDSAPRESAAAHAAGLDRLKLIKAAERAKRDRAKRAAAAEKRHDRRQFGYDRPSGGLQAALGSTFDRGADTGDVRRLRRRKVPERATLPEVTAVVRAAILEFAASLPDRGSGDGGSGVSRTFGGTPTPGQRAYRATPDAAEFGAGGGDDAFESTMSLLHSEVVGARGPEAFDVSTASSVTDVDGWGDEGAAAAAVFDVLVNLKNNDAGWLGTTDKLTRIKLEGALTSVLGLDMTWFQFDRFFQSLNTFGDGHIHKRDFVRIVVPDLWLTGEERYVRGLDAMADDAQALEAGMGSKEGDAAATREALYEVCDALEAADMAPADAFRAFDRNGSGEISTSEFTTLIRKLGGTGLPRTRVAHLLAAFDSDTDKSITLEEFSMFLGVVWAQRFLQLESDRALGVTTHGGVLGASTSFKARGRRVDALEKMLRRFYGDDFRSLAFAFGDDGSSIPGPFENMLVFLGAPAGLAGGRRAAGAPSSTWGMSGGGAHSALFGGTSGSAFPMDGSGGGGRGGGGAASAGAGATPSMHGTRGAITIEGANRVAGRGHLLRQRMEQTSVIQQRREERREARRLDMAHVRMDARAVVPSSFWL